MNFMQIDQARKRYIRWLLATRDLSQHTIRAYDADIASFARYLGTDFEVDQLDQDIVLSFIEQQKVASLSPASLKRRASALRGFCRWMLSQGFLVADPWSGTNLALGRPRKLPRTLPAHELNRLIEFLALAAGVDASTEPQSQAIEERPHESTTLLAVALMVATGIRVNESVSIRCHDIDLPGRTLRLVGKGRRERQVFLTNDWIAGLTRAYIEARSSLDLKHSRLLFNLHYAPLTPPVARQLLPQPCDHAVDAALDHRPVVAELFGEAAGGVHGRWVALAAERPLKRPMLADEGDRLRPGRDRVQALAECQPDHRADRVAGAARPARSLKLLDQPPDLGRIQESCQLGRCRARYIG
jgi:site-specific recombinase XerD